jgi:predicted nucleic acid-binding Zn ribbon protein
MKCPICGAENPEGKKFCGDCGKPLAVAPPTHVESKSRNCVACGRALDWDAKICQYCGHDYRSKVLKFSQPHQPKKSKSGLWVVGIIVAVVVVVFVLPMLLYVMVIGLDGTPATTPTAVYSSHFVTGVCCVNITSISKSDVAWDDVKVQLSYIATTVEWQPRAIDLTGAPWVTVSYGPMLVYSVNVTLAVTDLAGDGLVGADDSLMFTAADFGTGSHRAVLVYNPTGELIGGGTYFYP